MQEELEQELMLFLNCSRRCGYVFDTLDVSCMKQDTVEVVVFYIMVQSICCG